MVKTLIRFLLLASLLLQCIPATNVRAEVDDFTTWLPVARPKLDGEYENTQPTEPFDNQRRFTGTTNLLVGEWFLNDNQELPTNVHPTTGYWLTRGELNGDGENFRQDHIMDDPCDRKSDGSAPAKLTSGLFWFKGLSSNFDEDEIEVLSSPALYLFLYYKEYAQSLIDPNTDIQTLKVSFGYGQHSSHNEIRNGVLGVCFPLFMSLLEDSLLQPLHEKIVEKVKKLGLDPNNALSPDLREQIADQIITDLLSGGLTINPITDWIVDQLAAGAESYLSERFPWIKQNLDQVDAVMRPVVNWLMDNIDSSVDDLSADLFIEDNLFVRHKIDLPTLTGQIASFDNQASIKLEPFDHRAADQMIVYRIKKHQDEGETIHEYVIESLTTTQFKDYGTECGYTYDYWIATTNGQYFGKNDYTLPAHSRWFRVKEGYKINCDSSDIVPNIYANPTESGSFIYGNFKLYNSETGKLVKELKCKPGGNMDVIFLPGTAQVRRWLEFSYPKNGFIKQGSTWSFNYFKACRFRNMVQLTTKSQFIGTSDTWGGMYDRVNKLFLFGQESDPNQGAVVGNYTQITDYILTPDNTVHKVRTYGHPPKAPKVRSFEETQYTDQPREEYDLSNVAVVAGPYLTIRKDGLDITPRASNKVETLLWIDKGAGKGYKVGMWYPKNYYMFFEHEEGNPDPKYNGSTYPRSETDSLNDLLIRQSVFEMELHLYYFDESGIRLFVFKEPIWPYQPFPPTEAIKIKPNRFILPSQTILTGQDLRIFDINDIQVYPGAVASSLNQFNALAIEGAATIGWTYSSTGDVNTDVFSAETLANYSNFEIAKITGIDITVLPPSIKVFLPLITR